MKRSKDMAERQEALAEQQERKAEAQIKAEAALRRPESRAEVALAEEAPEAQEGAAQFGTMKERFTIGGGAQV